MSEDTLEENSDGDDWHLYASADYGAAESVEKTEPRNEEDSDDEWFDGDDFYNQGESIDWDSPPCPAPLGIAHVIKIGACDHCLHRIGGEENSVFWIRGRCFTQEGGFLKGPQSFRI